MPVRVWKPWTPEVVIHYGWRDKPYGAYPGETEKVCPGCSGFGTRFITVGDDAVIKHATCSACNGRGHE